MPAPVPASLPIVLPAPSAPAVPHTETVGVPDNAIDDVKKLMPAGGDASIYTVLLAAIGVAGGGAAWKFYQQRIKLSHEERMKELELQAHNHDNTHQKCAVERQALEAKLAALDAKLADLAKKSASAPVDIDIDVDEMTERLERLESAVGVKRAKKKSRKPPGDIKVE